MQSRRAILTGGIALLVPDAHAQALQSIIAGGSAYVGPIDIVASPTVWYGLRAGSTAIAATGTQKAVNIRRASDNATTDILILANGNLDVATAAAFLAATTGFVTKWYDQSGNGKDASQATAAQQPQLLLSGGANNLPYVKFVRASNQGLATAAITAPAQPWTASAVAERTGSFTSRSAIVVIPSAGLGLEFAASANAAQVSATTVLSASATDSTWHAFQGLFSGASSVISVDGAETSGNAGTVATSTPIMLGLATFNNDALDGNISEAGVWPVGFTSGNRSAMQGNQKAYWGTP